MPDMVGSTFDSVTGSVGSLSDSVCSSVDFMSELFGFSSGSDYFSSDSVSDLVGSLFDSVYSLSGMVGCSSELVSPSFNSVHS